VTLLEVNRILIVEHTRCAMASSTEAELQRRVGESAGDDASWMTLGVIEDQLQTIRADVQRVRSHPLIRSEIAVGGFLYDVDSGLLGPVPG
jgi:carbonic anhydrase